MTTEELNSIVSEVMAQIEANALDFDVVVTEAQDNDYLTVARYNESDGTYKGLVITWQDVAKVVTDVAVQAKTDAVNAKDIAQRILESVTTKGTEIINFVATSKNEIATAKTEAVNAVKNVYQTDLEAERSARESADIDHTARIAALESENARQKGEIENLKAKAEGQIYREEIVDGEAYTLDVPSSVSPYAEVQKIGGKSVVWNQLVPPFNKTQSANGISIAGDGSGKLTITVSSEVTGYNQVNLGQITLLQGHKYLMFDNDNENGFEFYINSYSGTNDKLFILEAISTGSHSLLYYVNQTSPSGTYIKRPMTIDLTQMFGSGKEPTLEECKKIFSADYYPYDAGTLKSFPVQRVKSFKSDGTEMGSLDISSFTSDLKSAGSVHDEWQNGKKISNVGVINLGDYNWELYAASPNQPRRFAFANSKLFFKDNMQLLCSKFVRGIKNSQIQGQIWTQDNYLVVTDVNEEWATESSFKQAVQGVLLYYELKTPTEETIPEIDNYIEVEGGGTLTFESDATISMPVPSTTRFVVDLT